MAPRGALMIEALVAVGIAAVYMSGIVALIVVANATSDRAEETQRALWHVNEGLDALQTLAFADLALTNGGSLTFAGNVWTLSTTGAPQTLADGMTRTVKVEAVNRDATCTIVTSGGTADDDSRALESSVTWTDTAGRAHTVTSRTLRTRFDDPQGSCFAATQAMQVDFNVAGAVFSGGKQLRQVYFTNNGGTSVTVDTIMFTWNSSAELNQLFMDTTKVWSQTGPGTPLDEVESGETMNIQDFVLPAGTTAELNKGQFDRQMNGTTLTMTVTFTDGSSWTSPAFQPQ